jgi:hypothetical protein
MLGTVQNGQIVLPQALDLPDGSEVAVEIVQIQPTKEAPRAKSLKDLMQFAGTITDLPEDSSVNVDHYLYGSPKVE